LQSKHFLQDGFVMDAYTSVIEALKHWALIELAEHNQIPELSLWQQVKKINPGVYKLYEELVESKETVELRVELILLACEFSLVSKVGRCCTFITDLLSSREEPWRLEELLSHPLLLEVKRELPDVLNKLVQKSIIKQVAVWPDHSVTSVDLAYTSV
jgi:hypothetical protein